MNNHDSTITVQTHRIYSGDKAGFYLSRFGDCGQFMEPRLSASMWSRNRDAHIRSVVNDFGDLVCVHRFE